MILTFTFLAEEYVLKRLLDVLEIKDDTIRLCKHLVNQISLWAYSALFELLRQLVAEFHILVIHRINVKIWIRVDGVRVL